MSHRNDGVRREGWEQFTSPDGHTYYYNASTKESRWELPFKENEETSVRPKPSRRSHKDNSRLKSSLIEQDEPLIRTPMVKKEKQKKTSEEQETAAAKPSNVMFLKLQASLEGRLGAIHAGPPPMLNIRREGLSEYTGGATGQEVKTSSTSIEEQYEAETAGMSAAERLRFLRKKRQENMMLKRESITGDDFMAEVANNMKKKGVAVRKKEEGDEKMSNWKEQEKAEEERKRRQMQEEMEAKKQEEERKESEKQVANEREECRRKERVEQLELERHEQEQEEKQRQEEENRKKLEKKKEKNDYDELGERNAGHASDCHEATATGQHVQNHSSVVESFVVQGDEDSDASSPERVKHRRHSRSQGSKHGIYVNGQAIKHVESVEDDHPPADDRQSPRSEVIADAVQDEKQRMREERQARKQRKKDTLVASKLSSATSELLRPKSTSSLNEPNEESRTRSTSSIEVDEDAKTREKQLRRERRRMAKLEAALAAQNLDGNGGQENAQPVKASEPQTDSSNGPTIGSAHAGGYPMSGQPLPGQPPFSGGIYPPYPCMMMPPPPSPYGYYYPYMQPHSMPMPIYPPGMVPPGYQSMPPTPPHSANGMAMPSALIPYGTDSTLANAYGYDMHIGGMSSSPALSRCDCCNGIGVGLVEKNGICAHCNRLRLAFIVDSAQMRLRCSVCGGWGFQLLQANGMCAHCIRQKSQRRLSAAARRPISVATTIAAVLPRQTSAMTKTKKDRFDDIDWDKSSDDSDWDD